MVDTIFGVDWDALTISAVRRFLSAAGQEPLTWEAKADGKGPLHPATVRKAICAFANSDLGGFLIIGATESGTGWALPGLQLQPPLLLNQGLHAANISQHQEATNGSGERPKTPRTVHTQTASRVIVSAGPAVAPWVGVCRAGRPRSSP